MPTDSPHIFSAVPDTAQVPCTDTQPTSVAPSQVEADTQNWTVEIFRAGIFTSMQGQDICFSAVDLDEMARDYDPKTAPAPLVVGHPKTEDPAYGWIARLRHESGRLIADIEQVSQDLAALVKTGKYRKISAAFFGPQSRANPCPGRYHLKHVGLLGAAAPAVPNLKMISQAAFSTEQQDLRVEFDLPLKEAATFSAVSDTKPPADTANPAPSSVAPLPSLFQALKAFLTEVHGSDRAERALPADILSALKRDLSSRSDPQRADAPTPQDEVFAASFRAMGEREAALRAREDRAFVEDLIAQGKPLGGDIGERVISCLSRLSDFDAGAAFSSDSESRGSSSRTELKALLADLPAQVPFGELVARSQAPASVAFSVPPGAQVDPHGLEVHGRILAWQETHPGTSYAEAALRLSHTSPLRP